MEGIIVDERYAEVLDGLGVPELIRLEGDRDSALINNLLKSVFYSNGNDSHRMGNEDLLARGALINKDGKLPDYIQMINLKSVVEVFSAIDWGEVSTRQMGDIRSALLEGVYNNGKFFGGLRRYRTSIGPFFSSPTETLEEDFEEAARMLGVSHESASLTLLHAIDFKLRFIALHPYEDGDGRTSRLIENYYLIKNGIKPTHISSNVIDFWPESTNIYHTSGCVGPYIISTLIQIIGHDSAQQLAQKAMGMGAMDGYSIALRTNILVQTNNMSAGTLRAEVERLYGIGVTSGDRELKANALWLAAISKCDSEILRKAVNDADPKTRSAGLYAMGMIDLYKYEGVIKRHAKDDEDEMTRMVAVVQLGLKGRMDAKLSLRLLGAEGSDIVRVAIARYAASADESRGMERLVEALIETGNYDMRMRAFRIMMRHYDDQAVAGILREMIPSEHEDLRKGAVIELNRCGKMNRPQVAYALSEMAMGDPLVRKAVLGELIGNEQISKIYHPLLRMVAKDDLNDRCTYFEKAYAIYMLGRDNGYEYIKEGLKINEAFMSKEERIALTLVKFNDFERRAAGTLDLNAALTERDADLLFVNASEVSRIIREGGLPNLNAPAAAAIEQLRQTELRATARAVGHRETFNLGKILEAMDMVLGEIRRAEAAERARGVSQQHVEPRHVRPRRIQG